MIFLLCLGADLLRMSPMSTVEPLPPEIAGDAYYGAANGNSVKNYSTATAVRCGRQGNVVSLVARIAQHAHKPSKPNRRKRDCLTSRPATGLPIERRCTQSLSRVPRRHRSINVISCVRLWMLWPKDVIVVDETLTASPAISALLPMDDPQAYYGLASGGVGVWNGGCCGCGACAAYPPRGGHYW